MRNVILLTSASNEMRGRAMSTVALTQGIGLPGEILSGSLSESVGPRFTVALQASLGRAGITACDPGWRQTPDAWAPFLRIAGEIIELKSNTIRT